eukprot:403370493
MGSCSSSTKQKKEFIVQIKSESTKINTSSSVQEQNQNSFEIQNTERINILFEKENYRVRHPRNIEELYQLKDKIVEGQLDNPLAAVVGLDYGTNKKMFESKIQEYFDKDYVLLGEYLVQGEDLKSPNNSKLNKSDEGIQENQSSQNMVSNQKLKENERYEVIGYAIMIPQDINTCIVQANTPQNLAAKEAQEGAWHLAERNNPEYFAKDKKRGFLRALTVFENFRGKGAMNDFVQSIVLIAKLKEYQIITMTTSSPITHHMSKKIGYQLLGQIFFEDYPELMKHYQPSEQMRQMFQKMTNDGRQSLEFFGQIL